MLPKRGQFIAIFTLFVLVVACAQEVQAQRKQRRAAPKMTNAQKIAYAMSAAPLEIAKHATIMDMTDMSKQKQLRSGTNGWVCYVMVFGTNNEAMCLDKEWQKWAEAWMNKSEPKIEGTGIAYMLRGDNGASNSDPYATGPTTDNQWVVSPPHIMVLYQDPKMLDAYSTDPKNGGPWVMWKGTPYAHVMVPVSPTKPPMMSYK
ncbi:MAG TPA: hypothetical protein VJ124_22525 [Pyrinomonadaceae bacterium]|nr:hypothetical protein [Pyrinomonadaceae bacterium]